MKDLQGALGWWEIPAISRTQTVLLFLVPFLLIGFTTSVHCAGDDSAYPAIDLVLSNQEREWIQSHSAVYFTGDPNWLPYEAFEKDGSYVGIVADHLALIEHYTGIDFVPVPTVTWSESLQIAMEGKVDVISGDMADAVLNRRFSPIQAYSHNPIVIIMEANQHYVEKLEQIRGKKIAIIKDYGYTSDIYTTYPGFSFVEVENIQQGLLGVSEQRFDAMLATMALASYHMAELGLHNIKVVGKTSIIMKLTLFVDQRQPVLHSIIDKTLSALPHASTQSILQRWVTRDYVEKIDYRLLAQILAGAFLLFAFVIWWIYRLRKEIHSRKQAESLLRESEQRYDLAMSVANDGIWDWNLVNNEVLFDVRYYTMAGYRPYEFPESFIEWERRVHPHDIDNVKKILKKYLQGSLRKFDVEFRFKRKQGNYMWIHARGKIVEWDIDNKPRRVVGTHSDISQQKAYEEQLQQIAHFDSLTNLPNRVLLIDRMNQAMYQAQRRGLRLAIVYLDLDGFKAINDENDHQIGDRFLKKIANRLQEALRKGDTLSRLGGDEFVAVLVDLPSTNDSLPLIKRLLDAAAMPVSLNKLQLKVSASIGLTFYPQKGVVDAEQLIRQADHSMYQAKLRGKNCYQVYDLDYDSSVINKEAKLAGIKQAFEMDEFMLYYQPKVNMHSGEVVGLEAFVRWRHPKLGILTPANFLSDIENTQLEIELGEWVIASVLKQLTDWSKLGVTPAVSINIGALHLQQPDFVENLARVLELHPNVSSQNIELEVLESSALDDIGHVSEVIEACAKMGVTFALDDFGTGYSSLTYLKQLPATTLKIDQNFVRDMLDDPEDLAILEGVIGIATAFSRQVIAEGVESVEQGELLLKLGCQLAQGYQISRPLPADKVLTWLKQWQPCQSWLLQEAYPRDDYSILFAGVEHRSWIREVERLLYWETEKVPIADHTQCSFGKWLANEGRRNYGDSQIFSSLEYLHLEIHQYVDHLIGLHYKGEQAAAKAGIDKLHSMRDRMLGYLNVLNIGNVVH
ncbi:MAG: EAL domain-containing protein [Candidatus Thiodiazotropha sp.]